MASRKEQKEAARAERLAKEQQAQAAEKRKRLIGVGAAAVLVLAIVVVLVFVVAGGDDGGGEQGNGGGENIEISYPDGPDAPKPGPDASDLKAAATAAKCKLVDPPNEGSTHVEESVVYKANPPTSGNHNPVPAEDKDYSKPPDVEMSVHSLEHGRVHIQVKPDTPKDVIGKLKSVFDEDPYHMMIYPNGTKMKEPVAITAWDHQMLCPTPDDKTYDAVRAFKNEYRDKGPEFVP